MGFMSRFFGLEEEKPNTTKEENAPSISQGAMFVTSEEEREYSLGMLGQILDKESQIDFIIKYLPEKGENLRAQAEAMKKLLLFSNNDQDPEVVQAFGDFMEMFHEDYRQAEGLSAISELETINDRLNKMFNQAFEESHLNKDTLLSYIDAVQALQKKVDEAEANGMPILTGPAKQFFTYRSLESEYRFKMLELLCIATLNDNLLYHEKTSIANPFEKLSPFQKSRFAALFKKDLDDLTTDYRYLSYKEDVLNKYATHGFSRIDDFAEQLNIKLGTQALKDSTFEKMFSGDISSEELFENIKKLVFIRYSLNEMRYELPQAEEAKRIQEEADREAREEKERLEKEEQEKALKEAEEARKEEERAAEAERLAKEKAEEEAKKLVDATDEEIQTRIDKIYHDVTLTGSRYVNILDLQKRIAVAKGLVPENDMIQDPNLVYQVYSPAQIIRFIKHANDLGVNYIVFPDSQEGANGGFNVLVSKSDEDVLDIPDVINPFGSSNRSYIQGDDAYKWKKYGTIPAYYLEKIIELYEKSDKDNKEKCKQYFYVDRTSVEDVYELGIMANYYGGDAREADAFLTKLVRAADKQLKKQWQDRKEDKDILSYVSVPAKYNIIPLLRTFKEKGLTPFFERVPLTGKRNTVNRDYTHIYFYRSDFEKFLNEVRPTLTNVPGDQKVPFEVHYGANYDFVDENSAGLNLPLLNEKESSKKEH